MKIQVSRGDRFGTLTLVKELPRRVTPSGQSKRILKLRCDCGGIVVTQLQAVMTGHTQSCGCFKSKAIIKSNKITKKTHGLSKNPLYSHYCDMISRCYDISNSRYEDWGGRGIKVSNRWLGEDGIKNFVKDMYPSYKEGLSIDRIDNEGNYSPSNCRWATLKVQARNTRRTKWIKWKNKDMKFIEACEKYGVVSYRVALDRIKLGWDPVKSILTPKLR